MCSFARLSIRKWRRWIALLIFCSNWRHSMPFMAKVGDDQVRVFKWLLIKASAAIVRVCTCENGKGPAQHFQDHGMSSTAIPLTLLGMETYFFQVVGGAPAP